MQSRVYRRRIIALTLAAVAGAVGASAQSNNWYHPTLVIVSIDGLRGNAVNDTNTPTIMQVARAGTYTLEARTVSPSQTTPAHASMLSGFTPNVHGLKVDRYDPNKTIATPTLLSIARQASLQTVMIVGKNKLLHMAPAGGMFMPMEGVRDEDASILREATTRAQGRWDILFIHLPQVDLVGHQKGWMSPEYLQRVHHTDQLLAGFLRSLPYDATILITADHGGETFNYDHGDDRKPDNMLIPWIITGPSIAQGKLLKPPANAPIRTMDTAVTGAAILGLFMPPNVEGKVVLDAIVPLRLQPDILRDPFDTN